MQSPDLANGLAIKKIRQYCAYQERCHIEVKEKLYSFGLGRNEVETLLSKLIEENYLNEERFAIQFAGGKFRVKHWGRIKIRYELKQKQVSEYCIKKALKEIDEADYMITLRKLLNEKLKTLGGVSNTFARRKKLHDYLVQKGFETTLIRQEMNRL
jgi:regulatory protein